MEGHRSRPPADTLREAAETLAASAEIVTEISAEAAAAVDPRLPPHRLRILLLIGRRRGLNLTGLARSLGVTMPRASRLCASMESDGLIERLPVRQDRREIRLVLTARGSTLLADYRALRADGIADAMRGMPREACAELLAGLRSFVSSLADPGDR
ncbi:MarR family winged helix-turn-helix transcriptional regulator [Streptomyces montanisoli]|uniref:MarR family transcriptional regulator n=1 Tax=Streptomyces montanisoli TaxID=2798581 RepID=A0A940M8S4_9ACTN|nr:MarR family transcriptional regulator [Streptomyces montanisoli]MBP0456392.1 MarR family transcriptional regulator [Streptomyces montanisoli]